MTTRRAACTCGTLSLACEGDPLRVSMCHCLACQQRTGSTFGVQARYARESVQVSGPSTAFTRTGDSGNEITFHFCATCGTTVFWEMSAYADFIAVAVGAFADPTFPTPKVSVYEARRHAWTGVPADAEHLA